MIHLASQSKRCLNSPSEMTDVSLSTDLIFQWVRKTHIACLYICVLLTGSSVLADAIPSKLEADHAKALIAYHEKRFADCVAQIDEVLRQATSSYELFELKALCLKALKEDPKALKIYLQLIDVKERMKIPPIEQAPYYFEVGSIYLKKGEYKNAEFFLRYAYQANFNRPIVAFYLGTIAIHKERHHEALSYLQEAAYSGLDDIKPAAEFYLGTAYLGLQNSGHALSYLWSASVATGPGGAGIAAPAKKALNAFDQSRVFATVSTGVALDTNVLFLPTTNAFTVSSASGSVKALVNGVVGRSGSPLSSFQFVPVLRTSYNYNFNSATKDGEFVSTSLSLLGNFNPYEKVSFGMKVDGNYTFQNQTASSGSRVYSGLLWTVSGGPFGRWILRDGYSFSAELTGGLQNYLLDATAASSDARTGPMITARAQWAQEKGDPYWNPAYGIQALTYLTSGTEFMSYGGGVFFGNSFIHSERWRSSARLSIDPMLFPRRTAGSRTDITLSIGWSTSTRLSQKISWVNDLSYLQNISSVSTTFSFSRLLASSSLSVSF